MSLTEFEPALPLFDWLNYVCLLFFSGVCFDRGNMSELGVLRVPVDVGVRPTGDVQGERTNTEEQDFHKRFRKDIHGGFGMHQRHKRHHFRDTCVDEFHRRLHCRRRHRDVLSHFVQRTVHEI